MRLAALTISLLIALSSTACAANPRPAATSRPGWKPATKTVRKTSASPAVKTAPKTVHGKSPSPAATSTVVAKAEPKSAPAAAKRAPIVEKARAIHGGKIPSGRRDCTGFVIAAYSAAGVELEVPTKYQKSPRLSEQLYLWAREEGRAFKGPAPKPGDVVFFRDTYGTIRGDITHIALVEKVEADGTIVLLHRLNGGIKRDKMHLAKPEDPAKNGYLRKKLKAGEPTMAGQLFVAFGRFDGPI